MGVTVHSRYNSLEFIFFGAGFDLHDYRCQGLARMDG